MWGLVDRGCDCREPCGVAGWGLFPAFTLLAAAVLGVYVAGGMSAFEDASTLIEYEKKTQSPRGPLWRLELRRARRCQSLTISSAAPSGRGPRLRYVTGEGRMRGRGKG
jgi:hypothetical protein